jgi:predicted GIY-YIG superfamily endonuclease
MDEESASNPTEKTAMTATMIGMFFIPGGGEEEAGAKGGASVYRIISKEGKTVYVGITNNLARRAAEHGVSNLDEIARGLTRQQARAVEQALIVRARELGIKLENKINSISPTRSFYNEALAFGKKYLAEAGFHF